MLSEESFLYYTVIGIIWFLALNLLVAIIIPKETARKLSPWLRKLLGSSGYMIYVSLFGYVSYNGLDRWSEIGRYEPPMDWLGHGFIIFCICAFIFYAHTIWVAVTSEVTSDAED